MTAAGPVYGAVDGPRRAEVGDPRVETIRADLRRHQPAGPREAAAVRRVLALVRWLPQPLSRDADPAHVTASAIVVDRAGRTLLHRHRRLDRWLQPGGHLDAGESPPAAARREAAEETGVAVWHPAAGPQLLHVDVHEGPGGHLHLDLGYLLLAVPGAQPAPRAGESPIVRWFPIEQARAVADVGLAAALGRVT